jgi:lysozyme family protein
MDKSDDYRTRGLERLKRLEELEAMAKTRPAAASPEPEPLEMRPMLKTMSGSTKTLEEALAEAEARIAERERFMRDNAAQIAQENQAHEQLNARMAALPQSVRRQVLDQAGLRHVSAAPAPIERIRAEGFPAPCDIPRRVEPAAVPDDQPQELDSTKPAPNLDAGSEMPKERQARRLAAFRAMGGGMQRFGDGWTQNGKRGTLIALARKEAAEARPMSDRKNVRDDLIAAIEAESARNGGASGEHRGC